MANIFKKSKDSDVNTTEHYLRRVLVGNVEDVRRRLNDVLERLDYDFIDESEMEIEARRGARGWATIYASADVLEYPRELVIKLKSISETSTRASFAYSIKHPSLNRGEKEVLTREAETIATLATIRAKDKICAVCGSESLDDSRFCRKCGTPMTGDETALEILRMSAEIRSGHTSVVASAVMAFGTLVWTAIAYALLTLGDSIGSKGVLLLIGLAVAFTLANVYCVCFGWKRLNKALKPRDRDRSPDQANQPVLIRMPETKALMSESAPFSVTEQTTQFLKRADNHDEVEVGHRIETNDLGKQ